MQAIRRVGRDVLEHVGLRAGLERARDLFVGVVGREHDHARARIAFAQPLHDLDALHDRHPEIQQRHVGMMAIEGLEGLDAVAGFGDDVQIGFLVDDVGHAGSEQGVIVNQQHAGARRGLRLPRAESRGHGLS